MRHLRVAMAVPIAIFLWALCGGNAFAQHFYKYEAIIGIGFMPDIAYDYDEVLGYSGRGDLYDIYEGATYTNVTCTPLYCGEFVWYPLKRVGLGGGISYSSLKADKCDSGWNKIGTESVKSIYILPQAKFFYVSRDHFKFYSGAACGMEQRFGKDVGKNFNKTKFSFEIIPVGMQWAGEVVFGFSEIGLGPRMTGLRLGIGYRFN